MGILKAIKGYFPTHPGQQVSSYGLFHPDHLNCGPLAGAPMFDSGDAFNALTWAIGPNVGHPHFGTTATTTGNIQSLNSSAAGGLAFTGSTPPGMVLSSPATVDGYFAVRGVIPSVNVAGGADQSLTVHGFGRFALPSTKATVERMFFGFVASGSSRVAQTTAIPASGQPGLGILSTDVGFSYIAQGATAFAGGATALGTYASFGITDDRYFTLGFRGVFSSTASRCYGELWINGSRTVVPAANLASFVTTIDMRPMVSLTSASGAAAALTILGAKTMMRYDHMQMYGV